MLSDSSFSPSFLSSIIFPLFYFWNKQLSSFFFFFFNSYFALENTNFQIPASRLNNKARSTPAKPPSITISLLFSCTFSTSLSCTFAHTHALPISHFHCSSRLFPNPFCFCDLLSLHLIDSSQTPTKLAYLSSSPTHSPNRRQGFLVSPESPCLHHGFVQGTYFFRSISFIYNFFFFVSDCS